MIYLGSFLSGLSKRNSLFFLLFLITLSVFLLVTGCKKASKPQAAGPTEVSIIKVELRDTPVAFEYVAQTQSSQLVNIYSRVSGFLDKRVYTEGAIVKAGDVLFFMDKILAQGKIRLTYMN